MKKTTLISLFVILYLTQCSIPVESSDLTEAKVTGAMQKTDNPYMTVVEDEDVKSGWVVNIKKAISVDEARDTLFMFFYTRSDPKDKFALSFAYQLGYLMISRDEFKDSSLMVQTTFMVFPKQDGTGKFEQGSYPIQANAQVNYTFHADYLPKTIPYELELRLLNYDMANEQNPEDYLFKVCMNIGGDINKK